MTKLIDGEWTTRDDIVIRFERLVYSCALKHRAKAVFFGYELDDLVSVGYIGLLKAYDVYDISMGNKFTTLAVPYIHGNIENELRNTNPGLHYSRPIKDLARRIVQDELDERPHDELSEHYDVPVKKIEAALSYLRNRNSLSMNRIVHEGGDGGNAITFEETIRDFDDDTELEVKNFIESLPPRSATILKLAMNGCTQQEIAKVIGVSQAHISRIMIRHIRPQYEKEMMLQS